MSSDTRQHEQPGAGEQAPPSDVDNGAEAGRAARESEAHYRQLADAMPQLVWTSDSDGVVDYYNARAADYAGLSQGADGSWAWQAVLHPDDLEPTLAAWNAAQETGSYQYEHRLRMRDGSYRWHLSRADTFRAADGRIMKWFGTATDIDDRKRAEAAATHAQERLAFLSNLSARLMASLDYTTRLDELARMMIPILADFCIIYAQQPDGWITRVVVAHADPLQERLLQRLKAQDRIDPHGTNSVARVFRSGKPLIIPSVPAVDLNTLTQTALQQEVGQQLSPQASMLFPLMAGKQILGAIGFTRVDPHLAYTDEDVTLASEVARRAALALENARLYSEARQAIELRDQFLSVAAHELKNQLTSLLANAQLLQRRTADSPGLDQRSQRSLSMVVQQARRLSDQISALLDLSQIEAGQLAIQHLPLDLCALVRSTVETMAGSFDSRALVVECPDEPAIVSGDALRLEQVVQNLIQNAVKYSPPTTPIHVTLELRPTSVALAVRDQGIGIPAAALPHLFERFYRATNAANSGMVGVGIGLYVVREIVTLHGGTVDVMSAEGEGSTFTVVLPLATPAE